MSEEEKKAIGEIDISKTIESNINYWRNEYFKQQKEIEELKEDNNHQWEERCKLTFELKNSTSNDKIKAKIKELEKIIEFEKPTYEDALKYAIEILQSLLEKE